MRLRATPATRWKATVGRFPPRRSQAPRPCSLTRWRSAVGWQWRRGPLGEPVEERSPAADRLAGGNAAQPDVSQKRVRPDGDPRGAGESRHRCEVDFALTEARPARELG